MRQFDIDLIDTRSSYSVKYRDGVYAHDFESEIRDQLHLEIKRFQGLLNRLHRFGALTRSQSKLLNAQDPSDDVAMGPVLNLAGFSGDFRHKVRSGPKRAIVVVQHAITVAIWHMLSRGTFHEDLGSDHFRQRDTERTKHHVLQRLRKTGVEVEVIESVA